MGVYHNKVRGYHNLATETAVELSSRCEILISRRKLFEYIELVRIHPDFSPGRPGSDVNDPILRGDSFRAISYGHALR